MKTMITTQMNITQAKKMNIHQTTSQKLGSYASSIESLLLSGRGCRMMFPSAATVITPIG